MGDKVGENPAALRAAVFLLSAKNRRGVFKHPPPPPSRAKVKGIIRVSKLQWIDLFYYLLDLRELANSNDVHKSLVGALFWKK